MTRKPSEVNLKLRGREVGRYEYTLVNGFSDGTQVVTVLTVDTVGVGRILHKTWRHRRLVTIYKHPDFATVKEIFVKRAGDCPITWAKDAKAQGER